MITDPMAMEWPFRYGRSQDHEGTRDAPMSVVRGFSHVSRSTHLWDRENSPLWHGSSARSTGGTKHMLSSVFGFRLALTLSPGAP